MNRVLPFITRRTARKRGTGGEWIVDCFAGAGGASLGIEAALGVAVDIGINHDPIAFDIHQVNHPETRHLIGDVWEVDPCEAVKGHAVGLAWFSPDCTHFSLARGGKPRKKHIRSLAWIVVRWAKEIRPRVIILENVREFQTWGPLDAEGRIVAGRSGETFKRWVAQIRRLGYAVEWRELVAADYGAPTIRRRLFLVARCDGEPIRWPERTHAPRGQAEALGLRPWRSAAECIDWSLPCPSIFERKRPLAEATMRRIALGLKKFVLEAEEPFIVCCNHGSERFRGQGVVHPMCTLTHARDANGLVSPVLSAYHAAKGDEARASGADAGLPTLDTNNRFALVQAFLAKHFGGVVGQGCANPTATITAKDHHGLVTSCLTKLYGTARHGQDMQRPMPTVTGSGNHIAEVRAFLIKYFSTGGQHGDLRNPAATLTQKHRLGLVTVHGQNYQIVDIGLRMLQPRELLRAQFGRFADEYVLLGTKSQQVAAIGNSVCPEVAEALVRANVTLLADAE